METKINPDHYFFLPYFQYVKYNDYLCAIEWEYYTLINNHTLSELRSISGKMDLMFMEIEIYEKKVYGMKLQIFN